MWRTRICSILGFLVLSSHVSADVNDTCTQLAIGIGQFEKVRLQCDTGGIDSAFWQEQLKSLNCSQVLGDDVLTQIINTANNDAGYAAAAKGRTQFCEQDGTRLLQQLSTPM
ncbi:hypothetical protein LVJ82_07205 [Vitreoscilla massiliensis]|uniref:Uncharacterized protein n=1 Tax=Vitreoscilla massiliensis TaxID=1689272 RepID=A0ABY4EBH3_9NEIS|nr:hypothetical protein [Vitreoscilla massiliensis]UOO90747.1 hypothetical protein LVJ82_07205 [Vitreoscilla massiliensis]